MNHDESAIRTSRLGEISSGAMYRLAIGLVCCLLLATAELTLATADTAAQTPETVEPPAETEHQAEEPRDDQTADDDLEDKGLFVETVVVTAQRREEELQKVPMTVTTLTGEELTTSNITTTELLPRRTAGLVVSTNGAFGEPYIRGIGMYSLGPASDPKVATYIDGVYQTRPAAALVDYFDVERIEVLKGPQGTLYGRNATGGAINVINSIPTPEFGGDVWFGVGNYTHVRTRGFVNVPLRKDKVFFRFSFLGSDHSGYSTNLLDDSDLADEHRWSLRAQMRFLLEDNRVEVLVNGYRTEQDDTRNLGWSLDPDQPSPAKDLFGGTVPPDPREVLWNTNTFGETKFRGINAKIVGRLNECSLTSLTAYATSEFFAGLDLDLTEVNFASNSPSGIESEAFTQELQIASTGDGPFEWLAGAFFLHEQADGYVTINLPIAGIISSSIFDNTTNAWAVFGEAGYFFTHKLRGTAGLRYSRESKEHLITQFLNGEGVGFADQEDSWGSLTPKVSLEYHSGKDTMYYALASRGFKSGGFTSVQIQEGFDPEYVWNYEAGVKTSTARQRVLAIFSGFYYDYEDMQLQQHVPEAGAFPRIVNAGKSVIKGVETEISYRPTERASVRTGLAYMNAEFTEFVSVNANDPVADPDRSGNTLPQAPEFSGNVSAEYAWALSSGGQLVAHAGYFYQSEIFFDPYEDAAVRQGGYGIWDARVQYDSPNERWSLAAFGANLSDKLYRHNVIRQDAFVGTMLYWGPPRTVGVEASIRF